MNDPPPFDERPRPAARRLLDAQLLAVLTPSQRRSYAAARGRILPAVATITPHTG